MISISNQNKLCNLLAKAYPNQSRNLSSGPIDIRVDDRDGNDIYPGFCDIHLKMSDPEAGQFTLVLDNVPFDDDVKAVAADLDGSWQETRTGKRLTLNLTIAKSALISRLAISIRQVVGRGRHYEDRNWRWVARRTAKALERLAGVLSK